MSFVCNLLRHILQNKRSSGRKRNRTQAGLIVQSKDHANAISGRYEVEQIEAILLLKLLTSEGSNLSKENSLTFSVFIIGCRIVRKPFADFVGAFIYFHFTERLGSGDGEREAAMTRQMPYEPLPASVLFALVRVVVVIMMAVVVVNLRL